jgi:hypothetical protein
MLDDGDSFVGTYSLMRGARTGSSEPEGAHDCAETLVMANRIQPGLKAEKSGHL